MKRLIFLFFIGSVFHAQDRSETEVLTQLLHQFMIGASNNDEKVHQNFWAEDLIYTSSSGKRFGKAEIMASFKVSSTDNEIINTIYTAEDIQIQIYDNVAIIAFKMKGLSAEKVQYYLNSGTFLKRENRWQVINWQATRLDD